MDKKKICLTGLIVLFACLFAPLKLYAYDETGEIVESDDDFGTCGSITWEFNNNGSGYTLTLGGSGNMAEYDDKDRYPWSNVVSKDMITSLYIGDGVANISDNAFSGFSGLTNIYIGQGVTTIGKRAFELCTSLKSISIPNNVKSMDENVFSNCINLESVVVGNGITSIPKSAFFSNKSLTTIYLPETLTVIGPYAFELCNSLKEVTVPGHVQTLLPYSFANCLGLEKVTIADGVKIISAGAFDGCIALKAVHIPDSVTYLAPGSIPKEVDIEASKGSAAKKYADTYGNCYFAVDSVYSIVFDGNGAENGSTPDMTGLVASNYYSLNENQFVKKGYTFTGWNTKSDGSGTGYTDCQNFKGLSNTDGTVIMLYAQWSVNHYSVVFNGNCKTSGNTAIMNDLSYDTSYTLSKNGYKRTGYSFVGWCTDKKGNGTVYSDCSTIENLTETDGKTVKLYAIWKATEYTITYHLDGGTNNESNPDTFTINTKQFTLKKPTKKGYTFVGWYTNSNYKLSVSKVAGGTHKNVSVYAKWAITEYKVVFKPVGANCGRMPTLSYKYGKTFTLPENTFIKDDFVFAGWSTKPNGKGKIYKDKAKVKNLSEKGGTVTLYAVWVPEKK